MVKSKKIVKSTPTSSGKTFTANKKKISAPIPPTRNEKEAATQRKSQRIVKQKKTTINKNRSSISSNKDNESDDGNDSSESDMEEEAAADVNKNQISKAKGRSKAAIQDEDSCDTIDISDISGDSSSFNSTGMDACITESVTRRAEDRRSNEQNRHSATTAATAVPAVTIKESPYAFSKKELEELAKQKEYYMHIDQHQLMID